MLETMTRFPLKSAEFTRMSVRHFHQSPSKKNTPVRIVCIKCTLSPHYPAVVLCASLSRFRSSDTGASGIHCRCASMSGFMPLKVKEPWTPVVSGTCFACTESPFQKFKTPWTGTTRRCECRNIEEHPKPELHGR